MVSQDLVSRSTVARISLNSPAIVITPYMVMKRLTIPCNRICQQTIHNDSIVHPPQRDSGLILPQLDVGLSDNFNLHHKVGQQTPARWFEGTSDLKKKELLIIDNLTGPKKLLTTKILHPFHFLAGKKNKNKGDFNVMRDFNLNSNNLRLKEWNWMSWRLFIHRLYDQSIEVNKGNFPINLRWAAEYAAWSKDKSPVKQISLWTAVPAIIENKKAINQDNFVFIQFSWNRDTLADEHVTDYC